MEQIMGWMLAKMDSNQKEMKTGMKAQRDSLASRIDYKEEKPDARQERMKDKMEVNSEKVRRLRSLEKNVDQSRRDESQK
jgi:hypothetical protein